MKFEQSIPARKYLLLLLDFTGGFAYFGNQTKNCTAETFITQVDISDAQH